jgi:hypothetical protein
MAERAGRFEHGDRRPQSTERLGKLKPNRACPDNDEMFWASR